MPLLCMDEYGNVYQAASHRADGRGVERMTEIVEDFRDNTLDASFKKQEAMLGRQRNAIKNMNHREDVANEKALKNQMKRNQQISAYNSQLNELQLSKGYQDKLRQEVRNKRLGSGADFDRLAIVDDNYKAKHMAALQYQNEKFGTKPELVDLNYVQTLDYSGKDYDERVLESEALAFKLGLEHTKEFAEYQTAPDNSYPMSITDHSMVKTVVAEEIPEEKSKIPMLLGAAALLALFL